MESHERAAALARILDAGAIGTWSWDRRRDLLSLDGRAARLLRLDGAGSGFAGCAREAFARLHPDDLVLLGESVTAAARRSSRFHLELRTRGTAGDEVRWIEWAGAFLPDGPALFGAPDAGETGTCAGIVLDVTERRRTREEVERAVRRESIGLLAGGITHDFNNILQTLGAHGEILRSGLAADDPRAQSVEEIRQAVDRAAGLTRQLLALSRRRPGDERILLVHADPAVRTTIESLLAGFGYVVVAHPDAPTALEALARDGRRFDLFIADVVSGDLLTARLRDDHPGMRLLHVPPGPFVGTHLLHQVRSLLDARPPVLRTGD